MAKLIEDPCGLVDPDHTAVLVLTEYELMTIAGLVGIVNTRSQDAHHKAVYAIWNAIMQKKSGGTDGRRWDQLITEHQIEKRDHLCFKGEFNER